MRQNRTDFKKNKSSLMKKNTNTQNKFRMSPKKRPADSTSPSAQCARSHPCETSSAVLLHHKPEIFPNYVFLNIVLGLLNFPPPIILNRDNY